MRFYQINIQFSSRKLRFQRTKKVPSFDETYFSLCTLKTEHKTASQLLQKSILNCYAIGFLLLISTLSHVLCSSCTKLSFHPFPLPWISPRPISTYQLNTLLCLHLKPIYLVVFKGSYLTGISHLEGGFTLRCLQRLSLPDLATLPWLWQPTDTPAVRPPRSSRTKGSSSQISFACAGQGPNCLTTF